MSEAPDTPSDGANGKPPVPQVAPASQMQLHPERPLVTRLSRRVLMAIAALAGLGIGGALFVALRPQLDLGPIERAAIAHRPPPAAVSSLPRNYAELPKSVPKLGPPLPGDVGVAMHMAGVSSSGMAGDNVISDAQQRQQQRLDAALNSHLFATTQNPQARMPLALANAAPATPASIAATGTVASSDHRLAFLDAPVDRRTVSPDRLQNPPSPFVLGAGSIIPAALITGIDSDLPGEITAQVTEDCYDSVTGTTLLVPQGSKLIGIFDAQVRFGQRRALLVWTRLILPNGKSIPLERLPGTDTEGYAGLKDSIDNHWGALFKAALLSTVLSVGSEAGTSTGNSQNNLAQAIRQGASQSFSQAGEQVIGRSLDVQPTITIRPGYPLDVLVMRDLVLDRYSG